MKRQSSFPILMGIFLCTIFTYGQTNLLDNLTWTVGSGTISGFTLQGDANENIREYGENPFGTNSLLWVSKPSGNTGYDGGWKTTSITSIDHTKKYMFTIWIKKTNSNNGTTYFSAIANDPTKYSAMSLDGTVTNTGNSHFYAGDLPVLDQWLLLVGYLHASDDPSIINEGRIYDSNGTVLGTLTDYKLQTGTTRLRHRVILTNDTNTLDRQYYYDYGMYEVNGQEPTIAELINPSSGSGTTGSGESVWNTAGSDIDYIAGNVGIGTTAQASYRLAVNGNIHTKEVKVDLDGWADYVFSEGYQLPTLEEVKKHIDEKGHLPNIPSAKEVETNGIQLGEMNKLLLEKIEELTLYVIELKKENKKQQQDIEILKRANR